MENEHNYLINPLSNEHAGWVFILIRQLYINKLPHLPMMLFSTNEIYKIVQTDALGCQQQVRVKLAHPICAMMNDSDVTFEVIVDHAPLAFFYNAAKDKIHRIYRNEDTFNAIKARLKPISSIAMTGLRFFNRSGRDKTITAFLQQIYHHAKDLDESKQSLLRCMHFMIGAILLLSKKSQMIYYSLIRDSMNSKDFKNALAFTHPTIIDRQLIDMCQQPFTVNHVFIFIEKLSDMFQIQYDMQEMIDKIEQIKSFDGYEYRARYLQNCLSDIYISKDNAVKRVKEGSVMPILRAIERFQIFSQLLATSSLIPELNPLSIHLKNMSDTYHQDLKNGSLQDILTSVWRKGIADWILLLNKLVTLHKKMNEYGLTYTSNCMIFVNRLNDAYDEERLYLNAQLLASSIEHQLFEHEVALLSSRLKI